MQAATPAQTRRMLLIVWFAMLCALAAYFFVMQKVAGSPQPGVDALFQWIFVAMAGSMAAVAIYLRVARIGRLLDKSTPLSDHELGRLRAYYIVCFAISEAVGLYGFVLYVLGVSLRGVVPFFAAAILLLLIFFPRVPEQT